MSCNPQRRHNDGFEFELCLILYDPRTGKRQKNGWIHTALNSRFAKSKQTLPNWLENYKNASKFPFPFGLHLLSENQGKPIAIVESAKTAIIMNTIQPKALWLAIGGLSYLNGQRLEMVKELDIVLYPDFGAFDNWKEKAEELKGKGFKASASLLVENAALSTENLNGFDIADYFLNNTTC